MTTAADRALRAARLIRKSLSDRASVIRAVGLAAGFARARVALRRAKLGRRVYVGGWMHAVCDGEVTVGDLTSFFGGMVASELICHPGAALSIGAGSVFNYGVSIEATRRVTVGARCKVGSMVRIADADGAQTAPIVIGDDVWIAHGAVLLPGATIGDGSVVSAGSVVSGPIPAGSLAVGNPARAVRLDMVARPSAHEGAARPPHDSQAPGTPGGQGAS